MKSYTTIAQSAERELGRALGHESQIYKPWQLENHKVEPIQIRGTIDEVLMLTHVHAYVRPNFSVDEKVVEIPNLFCKLNGDIEGFYLDAKAEMKKHPNTIVLYDGFAKMAVPPKRTPFRKRPKWFDEYLGIDVEAAIKEEVGDISLMRPAYQRNYLEAINRVLKRVKSAGYTAEKPTSREVLEVLLYNSKKIIKMYHCFDYQYTVPKFIVYDKSKKTISPYAIIRLLMMQCLGFDIFILSPQGYSSVENYLSESVVDSYHLTAKERIYSKVLSSRNKSIKWLIGAVIAFLGIALVSSVVAVVF